MNPKTQLERVKIALEVDGEVSRNWALRNYITRLASIIDRLKREGYEFESKHVGRDFVYVMTAKPAPKQLNLV